MWRRRRDDGGGSGAAEEMRLFAPSSSEDDADHDESSSSSAFLNDLAPYVATSGGGSDTTTTLPPPRPRVVSDGEEDRDDDFPSSPYAPLGLAASSSLDDDDDEGFDDNVDYEGDGHSGYWFEYETRAATAEENSALAAADPALLTEDGGVVVDDDDGILRPGDHVYVWRRTSTSVLPVQRHAIVLTVTGRSTTSTTDGWHRTEGEETLDATVVSFYPARKDYASARSDERQETDEAVESSLLREDVTAADASLVKEETLRSFSGGSPADVRKVRYGCGAARRLLRRAGTATSVPRDPTPLILHRVRHLLSDPAILPDYHPLKANDECSATWCATGRWCTLQGSSILQLTGVGGAGSAVVAGGIASQMTVLLPMPGIWGMAGWFWYVPVTVAYPFLVPLLVTYGLASLVPLEILRRYRKRWRCITDALNIDFWARADLSDDVRAEYFAHSQGATSGRDGGGGGGGEDGVRNFFGIAEHDDGDDEDGGRGNYMPVTMGGEEDDDGDEFDEGDMIRRHRETMAASFDMDESNASAGRPPPRRQRSGIRNRVGGMVQNWRRARAEAALRREKDPLVTEGGFS